LPADTLFQRAVAGEFDGVVAMYHDQGHIALKLIGFERAVNITLGLPIVRTSPSHGTAFDIAWQGRARPDGMWEAVRIAALLAERRRQTCVHLESEQNRFQTPSGGDRVRSEADGPVVAAPGLPVGQTRPPNVPTGTDSTREDFR